MREHTRRAKEFLALCRRFEQITTDYDILDAAINMVKTESKVYENDFCNQYGSPLTSGGGPNLASPSLPSRDASTLLQDTLGHLKQDVDLIRSYNRLFRERARIGINECFAVVNQLDAEVCTADTKHVSLLHFWTSS